MYSQKRKILAGAAVFLAAVCISGLLWWLIPGAEQDKKPPEVSVGTGTTPDTRPTGGASPDESTFTTTSSTTASVPDRQPTTAAPTTTQTQTALADYAAHVTLAGWNCYIHQPRYDARRKILTFELTEITTIQTAKPVSFTVSMEENGRVLPAKTVSKTTPPLPAVYDEFDTIAAQKLTVQVSGVPADFTRLRISLQADHQTDDTVHLRTAMYIGADDVAKM